MLKWYVSLSVLHCCAPATQAGPVLPSYSALIFITFTHFHCFSIIAAQISCIHTDNWHVLLQNPNFMINVVCMCLQTLFWVYLYWWNQGKLSQWMCLSNYKVWVKNPVTEVFFQLWLCMLVLLVSLKYLFYNFIFYFISYAVYHYTY